MLLVLQTPNTEECLISDCKPSARDRATRRAGLVSVDNEACRDDGRSNMDEPKYVNAGSAKVTVRLEPFLKVLCDVLLGAPMSYRF